MCFLQTVLLLMLSITFAAARIIELPNGKLQGAVLENYYSFTNIPYAERPVRFEPSVPYKGTWADVLNATQAIVSCVPFGKRTNISDGQEDCLYLNVFAPKTATDMNLLPVFVFIHGGAFMFASSAFYSPEVILAQGTMLVVSFNYRLGPFGFLTTGDEVIPGNLGLKDQLLALRWIKQNIQLFGGDPGKIILAGQSAGGAAVHMHILRKEAEDLVTVAASLSGTALSPWVMQRNANGKTETLAKLLSCPPNGTELKACLQVQPIEKIHAAVLKMQPFLDNPFNVFGPVVESVEMVDAFITEEPRSLIEKGEIASIPWMVTFTTEDGVYNSASLLGKNDNGVEWINELNGCWFELAPTLLFYDDEPSDQIKQTLSNSLREKYMGDQDFSRDTYPLLRNMFSDVLYLNGVQESIHLHRMFADQPVFGYIYGNPHNYGVGNFLSNDLEYQFGATHGDDEVLILPLTFSTNYTKGINDDVISKLMLQMFESFVLESVPSFGDIKLPKNGNTDQPTQYLNILQRNYCVGSWEGHSNDQCQKCTCYEYPSADK